MGGCANTKNYRKSSLNSPSRNFQFLEDLNRVLTWMAYLAWLSSFFPLESFVDLNRLQKRNSQIKPLIQKQKFFTVFTLKVNKLSERSMFFCFKASLKCHCWIKPSVFTPQTMSKRFHSEDDSVQILICSEKRNSLNTTWYVA